VRRPLAVLLVLGVVLVGCGQAGHSPAEVRLARALTRCGDRAESQAVRDAEIQSAHKAAEHLPRVVKLYAAVTARAPLIEALEKHPHSASAGTVERYYRLSLKVYEDAKALGVRCITRPHKPVSG
jgi:hypothetical protein